MKSEQSTDKSFLILCIKLGLISLEKTSTVLLLVNGKNLFFAIILVVTQRWNQWNSTWLFVVLGHILYLLNFFMVNNWYCSTSLADKTLSSSLCIGHLGRGKSVCCKIWAYLQTQNVSINSSMVHQFCLAQTLHWLDFNGLNSRNNQKWEVQLVSFCSWYGWLQMINSGLFKVNDTFNRCLDMFPKDKWHREVQLVSSCSVRVYHKARNSCLFHYIMVSSVSWQKMTLN